MHKNQKHIKNQKEMQLFAEEIASQSNPGDVILLKGTLGAGKSFFAANFINSLLATPTDIPSPTFNLLHSYQSKKGQINHFDLYRLKNAEELEEIGFFDCLKSNQICLIEWPEIAQKFLTKKYLEINIEIREGEERIINITKFN